MKTNRSFTATVLFLSLVCTFSIPAKADITILPSALRPHLNLPSSPSISANQKPQGVPFAAEIPAVSSSSSTVLNILDYVRNHTTHDTIDDLGKINKGYNRLENFGGWVTNGNGCQDTRAQVLVRSADTATPITFKDSRNCLVVKGLWHDPYAATDYKLAKAVQIDHVVPLKHVYLTGGKDWVPEKRCYYANFLHNDFHLLAVSGHENMAKSDKAPDQYMPPNDSFQCQYVSSWMKVKMIWQLVTTDAELSAIENVVQTHHCDIAKLEMTETQLQAEQTAITDSIPSRCQDFGTTSTTQPRQLELPLAPVTQASAQ